MSGFASQPIFPREQPKPLPAMSWAEAEAAAGDGPFVVPGIGTFARDRSCGGILTPLEIHPLYGGWTRITHLHADTFAPASLPPGWTKTSEPNGTLTVTGSPKVIRLSSGPSDADAMMALSFALTWDAVRRYAVVMALNVPAIGPVNSAVQSKGTLAFLRNADDLAFGFAPNVLGVYSSWFGDSVGTVGQEGREVDELTPFLLTFNPVANSVVEAKAIARPLTQQGAVVVAWELADLTDPGAVGADEMRLKVGQGGEADAVATTLDVRYLALYREP